MSRKARESAATKTLVQHVENRSTGRLSVGARSAEVSVWVLDGRIVAATSPGDEASMLRLAALAGALDAERSAELQARIDAGEGAFAELLDAIPPALADRLLAERFRSNLVEYLGSMSRPAFTATKSVFVDNIQIGHDSAELVAACGHEGDRASAIDLDAVIIRGPSPPEDAFGRDLAARLHGEGAVASVGALLMQLPYEPVLARGWIHAALDLGVVVVQGATVERDDWSEDDATEHDGGPRVLTVPISGAPEPVDDEPTSGTAGAGDDEVVVDRPTDDGSAILPEGAENVRSWLSKAHAVEESELDFFEDHDAARRGGSEDGSFTTGQHNLEKLEVNLEREPEPEPESEILEADEAPAARFSAPTINESEAANKVEVINTVLETICEAFDRADGPGRGRAAFQLLIEGSPSKYQAIFDGIQIGDDGALPSTDVVSNLLARPATEQRMLLTQALSDLVDRALSGAADELPDAEIDALLEHTAGYRARLGL